MYTLNLNYDLNKEQINIKNLLNIYQFVMKGNTPIENICIGTVYFIIILIVAYVIKLSLKNQPTAKKQEAKKRKYKNKDIHDVNKKERYQNIPKLSILSKSFLLKYTLIGSFLNRDKIYLLKEITFIGIISVCCILINALTLWPLALILPLLFISYFIFEYVRHDRVHCSPENKVQNDNEQMRQNEVKQVKVKTEKSIQQIAIIFVVGFLTVILISQTMFSIYNSMSNLGTLNISSIAVIIAVDQICIRLGVMGILVLTCYLLKDKNIFEFSFLLYLCSQKIIQKMIEIDIQINEDQNMGASPTKKKSVSPSRVPKAQPLYFENDTLMQLQSTIRFGESREEKREENPIEEVDDDEVETEKEKKLFNENELEKRKRKKQSCHQFYSAQRPNKNSLQQTIEDNDLVLIDAGFDIMNERPGKTDMDIEDINLSPAKKKKTKYYSKPRKLRQLIITENSPYLEYLPDMLKKEKEKHKNTIPLGIETQSRKVL